MQTVKTAAVVVILLGVLYGVYSVLTTPELTPPPEVAEHLQAFENGDDLDLGIDMGMVSPDAAVQPIPDGEANPLSQTTDSGQLHPGSGTMGSSDNRAAQAPIKPPVAGNAGGIPPTPNFDGATDPTQGITSGVGSGDTGDGGTFRPQAPVGADDSAAQANPSKGAGQFPLKPPADAIVENDSPAKKPAETEKFKENGLDMIYNPTLVGKSGSAKAGPTRSAGVYDRAQRTAESQVGDGKLREALATLSVFYNSSDLSEQEHRDLLRRLDDLAGQVVYSREHLLTEPYIVRRFDRLDAVASKYGVPAELLQNINGISNPDVLVPGSKLKVVPGPFRAEVNLKRKELTLFVQNLYAGRFALSIGKDPAPVAGQYRVQNKEIDRQYVPTNGSVIPGGHGRNPYGRHWIDLGSQVSIHGSSETPSREASTMGCISLSPIDARDVFGILSLNSSVKIIR